MEIDIKELISIIMIFIIFLSGFVPIVMGIIYYTRENRRLDREEKERGAKAASQMGT